MGKKARNSEEERAQARMHAAQLRELAERAEASLPPERRRPPGASNAEWLRQLAEKAQAEIDRRKSREI